MGNDYFIFYTEASIICILILLMILINDRIYGTKQETQVWFNRVVVSFILYFVSDACWAAVLTDQLPRTRSLVELFNLTNYIIMSFSTFMWFMYMAAAENMAFRHRVRARVLCALPMIISTLALVIAYAVDPYYWISPECEVNFAYYPALIIAPLVYILTAFLCSARNARRATSREERIQCWLIGSFPLAVLASGLVQMLSLNAPIYCFGCTLMLLFFYIQSMQTKISLDALTRLNNRGQINRYMEQLDDKDSYWDAFRDDSQVFIMMIDVDRFKEINDTYGHAEGDRALILVSDTLKQVCTGLKAEVFIGRYGGDEFTIILQDPEEGAHPEQVAEAIRKTLDEKQEKNRLPYDLKVSAGYAELEDDKETALGCLNRADEMLYRVKKANQAGR